MPESSYRPLAIQGCSSEYSGHQGQTSGQQSMARGCYECGDSGHMKRFCPKLRGKTVQQGHQPMITAPVVRPLRGGGKAGMGRPRGGGQAGGGQPAIVQPGGGFEVGASGHQSDV
uniref:Glycine-rich protein 2-like n=1 Tax=Nicotiana tabacum TaxID=4097 RepID=A0A1S4D575_TOBAC|nr:PREDICTED: glycine-rich protein 2-like [Nicotiana tabacum]